MRYPSVASDHQVPGVRCQASGADPETCHLLFRRRRAYTLLELLIVVAVLGLAGSLLVPYLTQRTSLETQAAVRMIIADLSFAQADALAHQQYRRVHFFEDGSGYGIVKVTGGFDAPFNPDTADYVPDPTTEGGKWVVDFHASSRFSGVSIGEVQIDGAKRHITYDQLGGTVMSSTSPGTGGFIVVASAEATYRINIAPFTGKLTVEKIE